MLKYLILIAVFAVSLPSWLPTSLGGDTSYHFVLTESMVGTLDPGAFVVLPATPTNPAMWWSTTSTPPAVSGCPFFTA